MANPVRAVRSFWRSLFDIRPGEHGRVYFMTLYLLFVLFAYYVIKPVSQSLFLTKLDIDELPLLQILVAATSGVLAYLYTKLAIQSSIKRAVTWTMALSVLSLVAFWWILHYPTRWMLYAFSIWASMFSIITTSQGWLVAANMFTPREGKRLYGLIGMGAVVGAGFGSVLTRYAMKGFNIPGVFRFKGTGTLTLLWASVALVVLAYLAFWLAVSRKGVSLEGVRAVADEEAGFSFREIPAAIGRHRHLQVIIGIMLLMFMADSMLLYQFSAMAKKSFQGDRLTSFLGTFGLWGTGLNVLLQLFFTAPLIRAIGVAGTLQVMPAMIAAVSAITFAAPRLFTTGMARLSESASRYTLNKTGLELLYLPLPLELRNRTKAFVDIFIDRFGRGLGGLVLVTLTAMKMKSAREVAVATFSVALLWIGLTFVARKEYLQTVRRRLETRRLTFETVRVNVQDPATIRLLEQAAASENPWHVSYALAQLADAPGYNIEPLLTAMSEHSSSEVRAKVYQIARAIRFEGILDRALKEIWTSKPGEDGSIRPAVAYVLSCSSQAHEMTKLFLDYPNWVVAQAALEALQKDTAEDFVTVEWLAAAATNSDPNRRTVAALAVGVRGDQGTEVLHRLLEDPDRGVATAACRAAASTQNRAYASALVRRLADPRLRGAAIEALASHGAKICGTLADALCDEAAPAAVRRQVPRVLRLIHDQRSADVLLAQIGHPDFTIRASVLKALNRLRQTTPGLSYGAPVVAHQVLEEARHYFELHAALAPLAENRCPGTAACLLVRTIEDRLRQTLDRLFRLLGLRYQPEQIYAAYLAVARKKSEEFAAALEFLDNVMDRELKRVILPLLDSSPQQAGRELFGIQPLDARSAVAELIRSNDPWLKACAIAAAAELQFSDLRAVIASAAQSAGRDVKAVARAATAALGGAEA